jgi:hypothetical protein
MQRDVFDICLVDKALVSNYNYSVDKKMMIITLFGDGTEFLQSNIYEYVFFLTPGSDRQILPGVFGFSLFFPRRANSKYYPELSNFLFFWYQFFFLHL